MSDSSRVFLELPRTTMSESVRPVSNTHMTRKLSRSPRFTVGTLSAGRQQFVCGSSADTATPCLALICTVALLPTDLVRITHIGMNSMSTTFMNSHVHETHFQSHTFISSTNAQQRGTPRLHVNTHVHETRIRQSRLHKLSHPTTDTIGLAI